MTMVWRFLWRAGLGGLVITTVALATGGLYLWWLNGQPPLERLPQAVGLPTLVSNQTLFVAGRHHRRVSLVDPTLGEIGLVLSLPEPMPPGRLPALFVLGGLGTADENIRHVPDAGANAVVGFDWPMGVDLPSGREFLANLPSLYRQTLSTPGQVAAAIAWLGHQPWIDHDRINLLGFSLGAIATPAIQRLAEDSGHRIASTILAYGGGPVYALVTSHPLLADRWFTQPLAIALDIVFRPIDPIVHLPHIEGSFLVMQGTEDRLIGPAAVASFAAQVPEPKTIRVFEGDHMGVGPGQTALLQRIIDTSTTWLIAQRSVRLPHDTVDRAG